MCYDSLSFSAFQRRHGIDPRTYFAAEIERLDPLIEDELVSADDECIRVTPKGRLLLRSIAMVFDRYIDSDLHGQRYSKAI